MFSKNHRSQAGFTLLEMTVVLVIVAIMTAIVLMNLPQMKGGLSIDVVAQEVAIYIRGAQVYSRATKVDRIIKDYNSYGIHFTSSNKSFFLWADGNNSADYKTPNPVFYRQDFSCRENICDPEQETYDLPNGFTISKLVCIANDSTVVSDQTNLDIVFQSPDPEAQFANLVNSGNGPCYNATKVKICLKSANAEQYRIIETHANGQIAVVKDTGNVCP